MWLEQKEDGFCRVRAAITWTYGFVRHVWEFFLFFSVAAGCAGGVSVGSAVGRKCRCLGLSCVPLPQIDQANFFVFFEAPRGMSAASPIRDW